MSDTLGIGASVASGTSQVTQTAPAGAIAEFTTPLPPAALGMAMLHATVIGSKPDGTMLLRTATGTLSIQSAVALPAGTSLDLKLMGGSPATAMLLNIHDGGSAVSAGAATPTAAQAVQASTSTTLDLGTTIDGTVTGLPGSAPPAAAAVAASNAPVPPPAAAGGDTPPPPLPAAANAGMPSPATTAPPDGALPTATTQSTTVAAGEQADAGLTSTTNTGTIGSAASAATTATASPPPPAPPNSATSLLSAAAQNPTAASPPAPLPIGTHLVLRIVAPPTAPSDTILSGQVVPAPGHDTIVDTPLGLVTLGRRLGLQPGDTLAFEPIDITPPTPSDVAPERASHTGGWPALDMALEALDIAAPALATQMRAMLGPMSGTDLGASLVLAMKALYGGDWPGEAIGRALTQSGHDKLRQRLVDDTTELRQLADSPATGDWRVLTLPLLAGSMVQPIRIYTRRGKKKSTGEATDDGGRFIVEVEMSKLGPLQLDGMFRPLRFDLVLRSHRSLGEEIRNEATAIFHKSIAASGIAGDIAFATASRFAVTPLAAMRPHVTVSA
jgi:hypothetical protein